MSSPLRMTRRQLLRLGLTGSVAVASCAVALGGPSAFPIASGQPAPTIVLGVRAGPVPPAGPADALALLVESLDLTSNRLQVLPLAQRHQNGTPVLTVRDRISAFTVLADGTFLVAITPLPGNSQSQSPTRLTRLSPSSSTSVPIRGLAALEDVSTLLRMPDGQVLGLAEKRTGRPPNRIVQIDPQVGSATDQLQLAAGTRFGSLARCPDGQLYASKVESGVTSLVNLNTGAAVQLSYQGEVWNNGLACLVCSATNQLFALGALRGRWPNGVHLIDARDGSMTRIADFNVGKFALM
jgi:hypothetical protein